MAKHPAIKFNSPAGRFVYGDPTVKETTDHLNRPIPEDKQRYVIGVAFPKGPEIDAMFGKIFQHTYAVYSQIPNGQYALAHLQKGWMDPNAEFSWKIKDGDLPNREGKINEHSKGCWVVYFSTMGTIKACNGLEANKEIDPATIKRGWYVDIYGSTSPNGNIDGTAGVYMNPEIMRIVGYGQEIAGGASIEQAFGAAPLPALPAGASTMPVAPAGGIPTGLPGVAPQPNQPPAYAPPAMPGVMPAPTGLPPQPGQPIGNGSPATGYPTNVQPHYGILPGAPTGQPPAYTPPVGSAPQGINPATGMPY